MNNKYQVVAQLDDRQIQMLSEAYDGGDLKSLEVLEIVNRIYPNRHTDPDEIDEDNIIQLGIDVDGILSMREDLAKTIRVTITCAEEMEMVSLWNVLESELNSEQVESPISNAQLEQGEGFQIQISAICPMAILKQAIERVYAGIYLDGAEPEIVEQANAN